MSKIVTPFYSVFFHGIHNLIRKHMSIECSNIGGEFH